MIAPATHGLIDDAKLANADATVALIERNEALETAAERGLAMVRVPTVGVAPTFVSGLVDLVEERGPWRAVRGRFGSMWCSLLLNPRHPHHNRSAQAPRIKAAVLLAYGTLDRRVPLEHGTRMRAALRAVGVEPEWIAYEGEGHGWQILDNRVDFANRLESFFARNLK